MKANEKINLLRQYLRGVSVKDPIYGTVALKVKIQLNEPQIDTLAIDDNLNLYVNWDFFTTLSESQKYAVLQHELLHVLLGHTKVRPNEKISRMATNIAMDTIINTLIYRTTRVEIETGWLNYDFDGTDPVLTFGDQKIKIKSIREKTWTDVYDEIMRHNEIKQFLSNMEEKHVMFGAKNDKDWTEELEKGMAIGRMAGTKSKLQNELETILYEPKIKWQNVLKTAIKKIINGGYTWTRPNKKTRPHGYYMPANDKIKKIKNIIVAIDVSGSISETEARQFVSEVYFLINNIVNSLTIYFFDTKILKMEIIKNKNDLKTKINKIPLGGGTDFKSVFDEPQIKKATHDDIMIIFTDGYDDYPDNRKNFRGDVLWCISETDNYINGHGDTIIKIKI